MGGVWGAERQHTFSSGVSSPASSGAAAFVGEPEDAVGDVAATVAAAVGDDDPAAAALLLCIACGRRGGRSAEKPADHKV